ncbi:hypothetical protein CBS101457_002083 [Exobasidium rhododendri]|nr:hypothetical protein CBS101457_002083 [Exobasidium rhododendri]
MSSSSSSRAQSSMSTSQHKLRYITSETASQIDEVLMSPEGAFSIAQLMELAGLACAQAVYACYPPERYPNVLVAAGPGNQGGDGLVAARHLIHFGYDVSVWYPKEGKTELFVRLRKQLSNMNASFVAVDDFIDGLNVADVVLDAIFGFSFKGEPRDPFKEPLDALKNESRMEFEARRDIPPIVSVDIPSGWDVNEGNPEGRFFTPQVILSLTAPKVGIRAFTLAASRPGTHFIGGRFIPEDVEEMFNLALPAYHGDSQIVNVTGFEELADGEEA